MNTNQNNTENSSKSISPLSRNQISSDKGIQLTGEDSYFLSMMDNLDFLIRLQRSLRDWYLAFMDNSDSQLTVPYGELMNQDYSTLDDFLKSITEKAIEKLQQSSKPETVEVGVPKEVTETLKTLEKVNKQLTAERNILESKAVKLENKLVTLEEKLDEARKFNNMLVEQVSKSKGESPDSTTGTDKTE